MQKADQEILHLIRNEETREEGFSRLVRQTQKDVYWLIRRMVLDHDDADDLAQETFVKVWKNIKEFRGDSAIYTWIYRIAANEALAFLKRKRLSATISLSSLENRMSSALQNDAFYRSSETMDRFQKALLQLPDKQRLVFNMKYFDELTYTEISTITGTSEGALKASYHHATEKIRKLLTSR